MDEVIFNRSNEVCNSLNPRGTCITHYNHVVLLHCLLCLLADGESTLKVLTATYCGCCACWSIKKLVFVLLAPFNINEYL